LIDLKLEGNIGWVFLNRPEKLNAINLDGWRELSEVFSKISRAKSIKAVVLTGAGRAFSAGDDIAMMHETLGAEDNVELFHTMWMALDQLLNLGKPVVAAVNGIAYGGGFEITLLCDYVIAAQNAVFSLPEVKLGVYPPVATLLLPFYVGLRRAYELILLGRTLSAEEALEWGLINKVVPRELLLGEAEKVAKALGSLPETSVRMVKHITSIIPYIMGVRNFQMFTALLSQTKAYRRGMAEFLEKRHGKKRAAGRDAQKQPHG